jgi:uncharacterized membrane protein YgdD (TMEM256/DUF423 family)
MRKHHPSFFIFLGSLSAFISVALGAFAAHALKKYIDSQALEIFKTGTTYQFFHALALILFGISKQIPNLKPKNDFPGWAFFWGSVIFSGSLYALAITGIKPFGAITPLGGILFLTGWFSWSFGLKK